jgi:hypothetical protein
MRSLHLRRWPGLSTDAFAKVGRASKEPAEVLPPAKGAGPHSEFDRAAGAILSVAPAQEQRDAHDTVPGRVHSTEST